MFRPGVGWQKVYVLTAMDAKKLEADIRAVETALGRAPEEWAPVAVIDTSVQGFLYVSNRVCIYIPTFLHLTNCCFLQRCPVVTFVGVNAVWSFKVSSFNESECQLIHFLRNSNNFSIGF